MKGSVRVSCCHSSSSCRWAKQLASPIGVVTAEAGRVDPRRYVHLIQPQFGVVEARVALGDLGLALAQRLDLGAAQHDAALEGLDDLVVVAGASIRGDHPVTGARVDPLLGALLLDLLGSSHTYQRSERCSWARCDVGRVLRVLTLESAPIATPSWPRAFARCPTKDAACLLGTPDGTVTDVTRERERRRLGEALRDRQPRPAAGLSTQRGRRTGRSSAAFHSHTHSEAYPSPTDVAQAPDPTWHYVLVSLRDVPTDAA